MLHARFDPVTHDGNFPNTIGTIKKMRDQNILIPFLSRRGLLMLSSTMTFRLKGSYYKSLNRKRTYWQRHTYLGNNFKHQIFSFDNC